MKTTVDHTSTNRQQTRWLITGVTTMILGVTAMANHVAYADSTTDTNNVESSQTADNSTLQQTAVALKAPATDAPTETNTNEPTDATTETPSTTPEATEPSATDVETSDTGETAGSPTSSSQETTGDADHESSEGTTTEPDNAQDAADQPTTSDRDQADKTDTNAATEPVNDSSNENDASVSTSTTQRAVQPAAFKARVAEADESIDQWMPNKLLQNAVLSNLQRLQNQDKTWNSVNDITKSDMQRLTKFHNDSTYIDGKTSYSLQGLEYATNLTEIQLSDSLNGPSGQYYGDVTDISQLSNLTKLEDVNIQANRITDITPLENLTAMTQLQASYNHISDFRPLQKLTNLKRIEYSNQFIYIPETVYIDRAKMGDPTTSNAIIYNNYWLPDGTQLALNPTGTAESVYFNTNTGRFGYRYYYVGATNGGYDKDGNIIYLNLREQKPGPTGSINGNTDFVPLPNRYYLTATLLDSNGVLIWGVAQPYVLSSTAAPVTVKYVDALTNQLLGTATLSGVIDEPYTSQRYDDAFPNYTFTRIDGNATGIFTDTAQTVIYYYTRKDAGDVTAVLKDNHGNVLGSAVLPGKNALGTSYSVDAPALDNYTLTSADQTITGTFTEDPQTVTFIYTRNDAASVTIKYQDEDGNELSPDVTLDGTEKLGLQVSDQTIDIPNYTLDHVDGDLTYTATAHTVTYVYKRSDAADVTIKYQDEDGNKLAEDKLLSGSGQLGREIPDQQIDIPGYTFTGLETRAAGIFTDKEQTLIYRYTRNAGQTVTVNYIGENGKQLRNPVPLNGYEGDPYQAEQLVIDGYTYLRTEGTATGLFTDKPQTVTFVYTRTAAQSVTVKYVDDQGNTLHDDVALNGFINDPYTAEQLTFDGYDLQEIQGNPAGTFTDEPQTVTFVYTRSAGKTVTVKYVDDQGNALHDDVLLNGKLDAPYTAEQLTFDGYDLQEVQGNPAGTFTGEPQTVIFVYTRSAGKTVTVKYVDDQGNTLHDDVLLNGKLDAPYTAEQLTFNGYDFQEVQGNPSGTFTGEPQTITFVYTRAAGKAVTVKYVDENGKALRDDLTLTGKLGASYTTEQLAFDGYTFKTVQGTPTGTFTNEAQTVTYVYSQDPAPVTTGTVTVHYIDQNGKALHAPLTLTGNTGDAYQTSALNLTGYQLVAQPANANGLYTDGNLDVTYVYKPVEVTTGDGDKIDPDDNQKPGQPNESGDNSGNQTADDQVNTTEKPVTSQPAKTTTVQPAAASASLTATPTARPAAKADQALPQTNEHVSIWSAVLGSLLAVLSSLGLYHQKRKVK